MSCFFCAFMIITFSCLIEFQMNLFKKMLRFLIKKKLHPINAHASSAAEIAAYLWFFIVCEKIFKIKTNAMNNFTLNKRLFIQHLIAKHHFWKLLKFIHQYPLYLQKTEFKKIFTSRFTTLSNNFHLFRNCFIFRDTTGVNSGVLLSVYPKF